MNPVAFKRIPKEIAATRDLSGLGIYYISDEDSYLKGRAMIVGPEGTPYANCLLFFRFLFPQDYPFSPPRVEFLTSDGRTRFHPNLYVCGKVCLSILGTYSGPSWQSTMSLSMILVSIHALLDENPLRNEPGYEKLTLKDERAKSFRDVVEYQLAALTLQEQKYRGNISVFEEDCPDVFARTYANLCKSIKSKVDTPVISYTNVVYGLSAKVDWKLLDPDRNVA